MSPGAAAMIAGVAAVAVLALAMVYAMVQWSLFATSPRRSWTAVI
jgi:hypothetical protein